MWGTHQNEGLPNQLHNPAEVLAFYVRPFELRKDQIRMFTRVLWSSRRQWLQLLLELHCGEQMSSVA
jgi:hypothetical protein